MIIYVVPSNHETFTNCQDMPIIRNFKNLTKFFHAIEELILEKTQFGPFFRKIIWKRLKMDLWKWWILILESPTEWIESIPSSIGWAVLHLVVFFYMFSQNSMAYISRTNPYMQIPSPNRDFYKPRMIYALQTDDFVVKNIKTQLSWYLWRHNSKWRKFTVFNITSLDFFLKLLWVRCDSYKPRMVYERQTYDFVVKNVKNTIFSTFMTL